MSGFVFQGYSCSVTGPAAYAGMDFLSNQTAVSQLVVDLTAAADAQSLAANVSASLTKLGSPWDESAIASYSWSQLNAVVDSLGNPPITNADCNNVNTYYNTSSSLLAAFQQGISHILPVPPGSVSITSNLTCLPAIPNQFLTDQPAYFSVSMTIASYYVLFALDGISSYVTLTNDNLDTSYMYGEGIAPLSINIVESAVQSALHEMILNATQNNLCR